MERSSYCNSKEIVYYLKRFLYIDSNYFVWHQYYDLKTKKKLFWSGDVKSA